MERRSIVTQNNIILACPKYLTLRRMHAIDAKSAQSEARIRRLGGLDERASSIAAGVLPTLSPAHLAHLKVQSHQVW